MLYIFGDSLTAGNIGIGIPSQLRKDYHIELTARGVDGDTMTGVTKRVLRFLRGHGSLKDGELLLIECGSNDLLLPRFVESDTARQLISSTRPPIEDPDSFIARYSEQLRQIVGLAGDAGKVGICTVPPLGEVLTTDIQQERARFNTLIAETAAELGCALVDISSAVEQVLNEHPERSDYFLDRLSSMVQDALQIRGDRSRADRLSRKRGLVATTDGVHLNGTGAEAASQACREFLSRSLQGSF